MAKKLYEETDVQAIAEAIRLKNGTAAGYKLSLMAQAIESLKTGDNFVQTDVPEYVKTAVLELAKKVSAVQTADSITFIAASDAHQLDTDEYVVNGNLHASMAMKALGYVLPGIDFCCFLGDYSAGSSTTTIAEGRQHFAEINSGLKEAFAAVPQFRTPGERDGLRNSWTQNGSWLQSEEIYTYVGRYNEGATYGSTSEGYCYRDFDEKKLRVICLNTSENGQNFDNVSEPQQLWLARMLRTVGLKTGWGIVILSHYPLDFTDVGKTSTSAANAVGTILRKYAEGGSAKISGMTISFKNANKAKIYATFHGHTHNLKVAKLSDVQESGSTEFDVLRIAIPNMCYFHNNEFGQNEGTDSNDIEFGEDTTYSKTHDTASDTSFIVNVINPSEGKINSFCYGAGYDREIIIPSNET